MPVTSCLRERGLAESSLERRVETGGKRAEDGQQWLRGMLKRCRARIRPEFASLGAVSRLPSRIGKPVTQEEVAEAAGISRVYYAMMESDRPVHVSTRVLARVADVLMMTAIERDTLFRLAVPELEIGPSQQPCSSALEAFSFLRPCSRRLWAASSKREVLAIASEELFTRFERPPLIYTALRRADGSWESVFIGDEAPAKNRFAEFIEMLLGILNPEEIDELHIYPLLSQPGEVCTEALFRSLSIFDTVRRAQDEYRFGDGSLLYGRIRSRADFVAGITMRIPQHEYSAEQQTILSAITLLTSLALHSTGS